VNSSVNIL